MATCSGPASRLSHVPWNHNSVYHRGIIKHAVRAGGPVLDLGCGYGDLIASLVHHGVDFVGVDSDPDAIAAASARVVGEERGSVISADIADLNFDPVFSTVSFVASLHHMNVERAIGVAVGALRPGGALLIVGLTADTTVADRILAICLLPLVRLGDAFHGGRVERSGTVTRAPTENLATTRTALQQILPGIRVRRRFFYRYTAVWIKPIDPVQDTSVEDSVTGDGVVAILA